MEARGANKAEARGGQAGAKAKPTRKVAAGQHRSSASGDSSSTWSVRNDERGLDPDLEEPDTATGKVLQREVAPRKKGGKLKGLAARANPTAAAAAMGDRPMTTRSQRRSLEVSPEWLESAARLANEWKDDVEEEFDPEEDARIRERAQNRWNTARDGVQKVTAAPLRTLQNPPGARQSVTLTPSPSQTQKMIKVVGAFSNRQTEIVSEDRASSPASPGSEHTPPPDLDDEARRRARLNKAREPGPVGEKPHLK